MQKTALTINNDYSWLVCNNPDILNFLWKNLRFRQKDYFHNRSYKMGRWDGFINFFKKDTGQFLTGLLPEVKATLANFNEEYSITDNRKSFPLLTKGIDENFLNYGEEPVILTDYQVDFTNQALKHRRLTIQAPTSSGKTKIMVAILKAIPENINILVLGNRKSIIDQNYNEIVKYGLKAGRFYGTEKNYQRITCATVQSAHHLKSKFKDIGVILVDEIHLLCSNSAIKVYKQLKNCPMRICFSATPFRDSDPVQKFTVKGFFGPIAKTKTTETGLLTTKYLQEKNRLSDSICHIYNINEPEIPYDIYIDAITNGISENKFLHKVTNSLVKTLSGRSLILVDRIAHGDALSALIPNSLWIQGKDDMETRKNVIEQLSRSKEKVVAIATSGIFAVGISFFTHNLIDCTSYNQEHSIIQSFGRGLRIAEDKEILKYYSFYYKINPYLEKHSKKKLKVLKKEGHKIIIHQDFDFPIIDKI